MKNTLFIFCLLLCLVVDKAAAQTVAVPDPAFLHFLKIQFPQTIDANDQLILANAAQITGTFDCSDETISSLDGIQYFTSIIKLYAYRCNLTYIPDLSPLKDLQLLFIYENNLISFPALNSNPVLEQIIASKNKFTSLPYLGNLTGLKKIDVGENALTSLPDLHLNTNLEEIICWSNKLTALPSLTNLVHLTRLNAGKNLLTVTPDLSQNDQMSILAFDNNFLTEGPDLSGMTGLTDVKLYNNFFSFEDILPYTSIPGFSSNFDVTPMKVFAGDTIRIYHSQTADLITHIDKNTAGTSYKWYSNGTLLNTVTNDTFTVATTSGMLEKKYYAIITNTALPSLQIKTDTFTVRFFPCPAASDVTYTATGVDCGKSGAIAITVNGAINNNNIYTLTGISSNTVKSYYTSTIDGLTEQEFSLSINLDNACYITNTAVVLPYVNCIEAFITPNMDGDADTYYINGTGNAVIYDKNGKIIQKLTLPYDWNGHSMNGSLVPVGYYIIDINQGAQRVYMSVLY